MDTIRVIAIVGAHFLYKLVIYNSVGIPKPTAQVAIRTIDTVAAATFSAHILAGGTTSIRMAFGASREWSRVLLQVDRGVASGCDTELFYCTGCEYRRFLRLFTQWNWALSSREHFQRCRRYPCRRCWRYKCWHPVWRETFLLECIKIPSKHGLLTCYKLVRRKRSG